MNLVLSGGGINGIAYISLIKMMYNDPRFFVEIHQQKSSQYTQATGIRQGCPLSPCLFVAVTDSLPYRTHGLETLLGAFDAAGGSGLRGSRGSCSRSTRHCLCRPQALQGRLSELLLYCWANW